MPLRGKKNKMPETKRPLKVFLCHAHADRDPVRRLYARLTQDGVDAWLDKEKLLGGADWEYEIRNAVRESDVVVVCHSKQFNQKGFRQKEVKIALEEAELLPKGEIFIIPARLEECDVLDDLKRWHWVDLFESDGYERLLRALRVRADKIGATLQVKRSWLPRITTPHTKNKQPAEIKKVDDTKEKAVQLIDEIPQSKLPLKDDAPLPQGIFPDGWDTEWMPSPDSEKAKSESDEKAELVDTRKSSRIKRTFNATSFISIMAIVFCVASVTLIPILSSLSKKPEPTPTPQIKLTNTVEVISSPSSTLEVNEIPSLTSTPVITSTPTPLPTEITDAKGVTMRLVPAGDFTMGSEEGNEDEKPLQVIYLDNFFMDTYEVTNKLYSDCVTVDACLPPKYISFHGPENVGYDQKSFSIMNYYDLQMYENYPVVYVNWFMAKDYCEWRGARLPTEAEWEKASRSIDGRIYPWGDNYSCGRLNVFDFDHGVPQNSTGRDIGAIFSGPQCDNYSGTAPIGSFGASTYGIYDLSGNVSEWVNSLYLSYPYNFKDFENSDKTGERVYRGDSFFSNPMRSSQRKSAVEEYTSTDLGFRCAYSP